MKKPNFKNLTKKQKILLIIGIVVAIALIVAMVRSFMVTPSTDDYSYEDKPTYEKAQRMDVENSISAKGEVISGLEEDKVPHAGWKLKSVDVKENEEIKEGESILTYTNGKKMSAPYNCVVKEWDLPNLKGELSNDNKVTIAGTSVLNMDLAVSEEDVLKVKKGYSATVKVKATGKKYHGYVSYISDVGQYSDGSSTFQVKVSFDNDGQIRLGMNGRAKISLGKVYNVIAVPVDAVYKDGNNSYVTVKTKKKDDNGDPVTKEVQVVTGLEGKNYIEIKSGLKEGQKVLVNSSEEEYY